VYSNNKIVQKWINLLDGLAFVGYRNNMAKKINYHTIGELFCGPGGGGLGASLAMVETEGCCS
jgi:hypothetical protein